MHVRLWAKRLPVMDTRGLILFIIPLAYKIRVNLRVRNKVRLVIYHQNVHSTVTFILVYMAIGMGGKGGGWEGG